MDSQEAFSTLGKLSNLSVLFLGENWLTGGLPQSLFNVSSLQILGSELTGIGGVLPPNIGDALPNLQWLYMDSSMFHGHIPASLGNASRLVVLNFASNNFNGQVPNSLGKLQTYVILIFRGTWLRRVTQKVGNFCLDWETVLFHKCCMIISYWEAYWSQDAVCRATLKLYIWEMTVYPEKFPKALGDLIGLIALDLGANNLTGNIGEWIKKADDSKVSKPPRE